MAISACALCLKSRAPTYYTCTRTRSSSSVIMAFCYDNKLELFKVQVKTLVMTRPLPRPAPQTVQT